MSIRFCRDSLPANRPKQKESAIERQKERYFRNAKAELLFCMIFVKAIGLFHKEIIEKKSKTEGCQAFHGGGWGILLFARGCSGRRRLTFPLQSIILIGLPATEQEAQGRKMPGSGSGDHAAALGEYAQPDKNQITGCSADGSAPALGAGCRRFKSCHSDHSRAGWRKPALFFHV